MRWFRRQPPADPGRRDAVLHDVRTRYGAHVQAPFRAQADEAARLLDGDDGLAVAGVVLQEFADAAYAKIFAQAGRAADRRNYRRLFKDVGTQLQWPMFALPYHPYIQVAAAVTAVGADARRAIRVTPPAPLLAHVLEVLDLMTAGWEYARVLVDADGAALAHGAIVTTRHLHDAIGDPPPLPPPVRDLMRRNNTITVHHASGIGAVGTLNPGAEMRRILLT